MGIRKKGKRKITIDSRLYLWWAGEDPDRPANIVKIWSDDKKLQIRYELNQTIGEEYIGIIGPEFAGKNPNARYQCYLCPRFDENGSITPKIILQIIEWFLDKSLERTEATFTF